MSRPHPASGARPTLALVRSNNRRGAVAEALALLDDLFRKLVASHDGSVDVWPVIAASRRRASSPGAVASLVDHLIARGARTTIILGPGMSDPQNLRAECWGRAVEFASEGSGPAAAKVVFATPVELGVLEDASADHAIVEGLVGWAGRRALAVAGDDPSAVLALACHSLSRRRRANAYDLAACELRGDSPDSHGTIPAPHRAPRQARPRRPHELV